jgi:MFS family permease
LRLLPFLFVLHIANYVDRTNLAYAALGMSRDLGFSDHVFGLGAGIFFLSYLVLQVPGARLVERWSARRVITMTMVAWGLARRGVPYPCHPPLQTTGCPVDKPGNSVHDDRSFLPSRKGIF